MKTEAQELLRYLHQQFPATIGHLPLVQKLDALYLAGELAGMTEAAKICEQHENNQANQTVKTFGSAVAAEQSRQDKMAILTARDAKAITAKEGK